VEIITNEVENPLRFPGQYYDEETGLHQNFHRDYNPALGRYVEADPIGMWGGISLYGYAAISNRNVQV
jgi:RHS repeat-associated protein